MSTRNRNVPSLSALWAAVGAFFASTAPGALLRLLFGGVRDDHPADVLFAFVDALNKEAVG